MRGLVPRIFLFGHNGGTQWGQSPLCLTQKGQSPLCPHCVPQTYRHYGEKHLENQTNKIPPANNVYIIHEWWKTNGDEIKRRLRNSIPSIVPEVMEYYSETNALYGAQKVKYIGDL